MPGSVHVATVSGIHPLAPSVIEYRLSLAAGTPPLAFRPGQFVSIACGEQPGATLGAPPEPVLRSYSLASSPGAPTIDLVLKLVPGGRASEWFRALALGSPVRFTGPMGFFVLDAAPHAGDLVFAATGTGIAPIVPMVREAVARGEPGAIHLFWGLRHEEDLFWREPLAALGELPRVRVHVHLSQPGPSWRGARGRIVPPILDALSGLADPTFYLCGNGAMIKELKAGLVARGVPRKQRIRTEAFFD